MTRLFNDSDRFRDELIDGFVAAHSQWVRMVPGGVARRTRTSEGNVAVVIGGGSGHYPAFAGLVGQGLASGAVMGNVFASPSAARIVSVAKAAEHGGGIGMQRGAHAAVAAAQETRAAGAGGGSTLVAAADAWADRSGGTSGARGRLARPRPQPRTRGTSSRGWAGPDRMPSGASVPPTPARSPSALSSAPSPNCSTNRK
jgi:dihydroxyacetone kinase